MAGLLAGCQGHSVSASRCVNMFPACENDDLLNTDTCSHMSHLTSDQGTLRPQPQPLTQEEEVSLVTQIIPIFAAFVIGCALAGYCVLKCRALVCRLVKEEEEGGVEESPAPHEAGELIEVAEAGEVTEDTEGTEAEVPDVGEREEEGGGDDFDTDAQADDYLELLMLDRSPMVVVDAAQAAELDEEASGSGD